MTHHKRKSHLNAKKIAILTGLLGATLSIAGASWADATDLAPAQTPTPPARRAASRANTNANLNKRIPTGRAAVKRLPASTSAVTRRPSAADSEKLPAAPNAASSADPVMLSTLADATPPAPADTSPQLGDSTDFSSGISTAEHPDGYLWIYGGLDAGTMSVTTSALNEANQSGYQIRPKLLGSYYINQDWLLDAGLGWARFSVDTDSKNTTVATRAGFVEASPKWRPSDRWALGPVVDMYYGTDLSLAESYESSGVAFFGGAQGQFDLPVASSWRMRLGASLLTSIGVDQRQAFTALAGLQIGLPVTKLK